MKTKDGVDIKAGDKVWVMYNGISQIVTVVRCIKGGISGEHVELIDAGQKTSSQFIVDLSQVYVNHPHLNIPATADIKHAYAAMKLHRDVVASIDQLTELDIQRINVSILCQRSMA